MLSFLLLALFSASAMADDCPSPAAPAPGVLALESAVTSAVASPEALALAGMLDRVGLECPNRVWPSDFLGKTQVLLVDSTREEAWLWNAGGSGRPQALQPVPWAEVAGRAELRSPYAFMDWNGVPTTSISMNFFRGPPDGRVDPRAALELAVHEAFHRYEQPTWGLPASPPSAPFADRAVELPFDPAPRYLRSRMLRAFRDSIREPGRRDEHLAHAGHWHGRHAHEFPADRATASRNDIMEGTARYYETFAGLIAEHGCGASEEQLRAALAERIAPIDPATFNPATGRPPIFMDAPQPGGESYDLFVALAATRFSGVPGWEARIRAGEAPDTVALGGVTATRAEDDPARLEEIGRMAEGITATGGPLVNQLSADYESRDMVRISVPLSARAGAFTSEGFFRTAGLPGVAARDIQRFMNWEGGTFRLETAPNSGDYVGTLLQESNACGAEPAVVLMVPRSALRSLEGGGTEYEAPGVNVSGRLESRADAAGRSWLCAR